MEYCQHVILAISLTIMVVHFVVMKSDEENIITRSSQTPGTIKFIYSKRLLCTTGCRTKQWRCLIKSLGCTSHCHGGK